MASSAETAIRVVFASCRSVTCLLSRTSFNRAPTLPVSDRSVIAAHVRKGAGSSQTPFACVALPRTQYLRSWPGPRAGTPRWQRHRPPPCVRRRPPGPHRCRQCRAPASARRPAPPPPDLPAPEPATQQASTRSPRRSRRSRSRRRVRRPVQFREASVPIAQSERVEAPDARPRPRHRAALEVHSISPAGQGDVEPVVDDHQRAVRSHTGANGPDQADQRASRQVWLADLDQAHARRRGRRDLGQQSVGRGLGVGWSSPSRRPRRWRSVTRHRRGGRSLTCRWRFAAGRAIDRPPHSSRPGPARC